MQDTRATSIILAVVTVCVSLVTASMGAEYKRGDEVVALRDVELKVEAQAVGTVQKGEKLTVQDVQGEWLWVRRGETLGWIYHDHVVGVRDITGTWQVTSPHFERSLPYLIEFSDGHVIVSKPGTKRAAISGQMGLPFWTYDGKSIRFARLAQIEIGDTEITLGFFAPPFVYGELRFGGKWETHWKSRDQIDITNADGNKMKLRRHKETKKK